MITSERRDRVERALARFPLVPRSRPRCGPLSGRRNEIRELAETALGESGWPAVLHAAEACNRAALIFSDCGDTDTARALCRSQYAVFCAATPLSVEAAELALQPIVNRVRLLGRTGAGGAAHHALESLLLSFGTRGDVDVDGEHVDFAVFLRPGNDAPRLRQWLWAVLLADGTKALAGAGRWDEAADCAARHRGVGRRLFDGRQAAVIARWWAGQEHEALGLIDTSMPQEPWEHVVAECLRAVCLPRGDGHAEALARAIRHRAGLSTDPGWTAWRVRAGLSIVDAADARDVDEDLVREVVAEAVQVQDAYVAREVLRHPLCGRTMSGPERVALVETMETSWLGPGPMPAASRNGLIGYVKHAEDVLKRELLGAA